MLVIALQQLAVGTGPCYIMGTMNIAEPESPRYQFGLQSLLLFVLLVAVLCSIGVYTHWLVSVVLSIGCVFGWLFAGTRAGLIQGALVGSMFAVGAEFVCGFLWCILYFCSVTPDEFLGFGAAVKIGAGIGAIIGGVLGGLSVRHLHDDTTDMTDTEEVKRAPR
jgi:uncharacterized membrane protein